MWPMPLDAPHRHADVLGEALLGKQRPAGSDHGDRVGEEGLGDEAAEGCERPQRDEDDEEQHAQPETRAGGDGSQWLQVIE